MFSELCKNMIYSDLFSDSLQNYYALYAKPLKKYRVVQDLGSKEVKRKSRKTRSRLVMEYLITSLSTL